VRTFPRAFTSATAGGGGESGADKPLELDLEVAGLGAGMPSDGSEVNDGGNFDDDDDFDDLGGGGVVVELHNNDASLDGSKGLNIDSAAAADIDISAMPARGARATRERLLGETSATALFDFLMSSNFIGI
jgi:hypothetical protein